MALSRTEEGAITISAAAISRAGIPGHELGVGNPSGTLSLGAKVTFRGVWIAESAIVFRTARKLMQGVVAI